LVQLSYCRLVVRKWKPPLCDESVTELWWQMQLVCDGKCCNQSCCHVNPHIRRGNGMSTG
jgi:hypothetical protein